MNDEMTKLARRAVACTGWRWMPGMLDLRGDRLGLADSGFWSACGAANRGDLRTAYTPDKPDLTDPATLGCLLRLAWEASADEAATAGMGSNRLLGRALGEIGAGRWESAAALLVRALEAAVGER